MFLALPDPLVRGTDPDPSIINVLWPLYDFLSLKNDVNVASKSIKQQNLAKNYF